VKLITLSGGAITDKKSIDEMKFELDKAHIEREAKHFDFIEKNQKESWKRTIVTGMILAVFAWFINEGSKSFSKASAERNLDESNYQLDTINAEADAEIRVRETNELFKLLTLDDPNLREKRLCYMYENGIFTSESVISELDLKVSNGEVCKKLNETKAAEQKIESKKENCETQATYVTDYCRAYDKSGFHESPKATCGLSLKAGSGRFFNQDAVEVVSEYYKKRTGAAAISMQSNLTDGLITSFSGRIGCTNSKGTGRTCEAKATVRAKSYPIECKDILIASQ